MNQNALEEARSLLEQTDKNRSMVEQVPTFFLPLVHLESTGAGDLTCQNQAIQGAKMKCEQEGSVMNHDLDEMRSEAAMSEEKATRCSDPDHQQIDQLHDQVDGGCGATCRRAEKRAGLRTAFERDKKLLEAQVSPEWT